MVYTIGQGNSDALSEFCERTMEKGDTRKAGFSGVKIIAEWSRLSRSAPRLGSFDKRDHR
jgi:hypothetical protein